MKARLGRVRTGWRRLLKREGREEAYRFSLVVEAETEVEDDLDPTSTGVDRGVHGWAGVPRWRLAE